MAAEWFVQADGGQLGPLSPPEMRHLVQEGRVVAETLVRLGADGKWVPAGRVRGLLPETAAATPVREAAPARAPLGSAPASPARPRLGEKPPAAAHEAAAEKPKRLGREPSEVLAAKTARPAAPPRVEPASEPAPTSTPVEVMTGLPPDPKPSPVLTGLGLTSVACGGLALLMAWSTTAVLALTMLGVVISLGAIAWAVARRRTGLGTPVTGMVLCLGVLATVFAYQFIVGDRFSGGMKLESTARRNTEAVALSEAESDWVQFDNDVQWTRSNRASLIGDVEVRVVGATFDRVKLSDLGTEQDSKDAYVIVRISLRNTDRDRRVEYRGWSGSGALTDAGLAELTDRNGKKYNREDFGLGLNVSGQVSTASISPSESIEDVLVFKSSGKESDMYRLELPGSAVGEDGAYRFAIPADTINRVVE
ncbi:MAG: DUF4339 domain-containing protein [Pirellulales bacterium]|nr:DUF4339 domain-containing protein [Pirellulales bacterium]